MTNIQHIQEQQAEAAGRPAVDPFTAVGRLSQQALSPSEFARKSIEIVALYFNAPAATINRRLPSGDIHHRYAPEAPIADAWAGVLDRLALLAQGEGRAVARIYGDQAHKPRVAVLSSPMINSSGEGSGAVAVMVACAARPEAERALSELRALSAFIGLEFPGPAGARRSAPAASAAGLTGAMARASSYQTLHEFAFAITNSLRNRVGCDQVAMSTARGSGIRLLSISGMDDLKPRSPGTLRIRQAMEECLDRAEPIVCQHSQAWDATAESDGHRLHRQWHEETGRAAVLSIPLLDGESVVGVLSLRRAATCPFTGEDIKRTQEMIKPLGPAMRLVTRASRSLPVHARDAVLQSARWLVRPVGVGRKLTLAALIGLGAWFCLGRMSYQVAVPGVIAPSQTRSIAAPFEASIEEVLVRAGDRVSAGQPLVRFDTQDLELRRHELEAEREVESSEIDKAIATGDIGEAGLASARRQIVDARLALVQARLDRALVVAPEDGLILMGDLSKRLGETVPLGEPLFSFAPTSRIKVEIEIPEALVDDVAGGFPARFASDAPEAPDVCTVGTIHPAAEVRRGRTVFVADAEFASGIDNSWMRVGMEGVARIDCGPRPVWWISLHKAIDYLHLRVLP